MTNKEWLEKMRKDDEINFKDVDNDLLEFLQEQIYSDELDYRRTRATEIIAEELIKLNENFGLLEKVYDKSEKAIRVTND